MGALSRSGPFHLSGAPIGDRHWWGFDFPIMPSIASLTPGTISAPPREASIVPPHCRAIIPGSNEERLSLRGALTDTSPTHLSTNQTPGVGSHIELRAASVKLRRRHIAASLSLSFSPFHPFLSISATSLSLTGRHLLRLALVLCQPSTCSRVFVFFSQQEKSDFQQA